jgi:hypothetical protein
LFKEIIQFNPEKLQAGGGSGLGLWITNGIVGLHAGQISVYSEGEGHGCSFTVKIPMIRCPPRQSIGSQSFEGRGSRSYSDNNLSSPEYLDNRRSSTIIEVSRKSSNIPFTSPNTVIHSTKDLIESRRSRYVYIYGFYIYMCVFVCVCM